MDGVAARIDHPDDWVRREITVAFQHGVRVVPVLLDGVGRLDGSGLPADIVGLGNCQYLRLHPRNDEYDLCSPCERAHGAGPGFGCAWRENRIRRIPELGVTSRAVDECPYPGMASFGVDQDRWFFGRERLTAQICLRMDECLREGGPVMVAAPSGAGKSSLLRAGVLPALAGDALPGSRHWPQVILTPTAQPMLALATRLAAGLGVPPDRVRAAAVDGPAACAALVRAALEARPDDAGAVGARLVVIVDQLVSCSPTAMTRRSGGVSSNSSRTWPRPSPKHNDRWDWLSTAYGPTSTPHARTIHRFVPLCSIANCSSGR